MASTFEEVKNEFREIKHLLKREFTILNFSMQKMEEKLKNVGMNKNREWLRVWAESDYKRTVGCLLLRLRNSMNSLRKYKSEERSSLGQ